MSTMLLSISPKEGNKDERIDICTGCIDRDVTRFVLTFYFAFNCLVLMNGFL